jgi:hypothetical protein
MNRLPVGFAENGLVKFQEHDCGRRDFSKDVVFPTEEEERRSCAKDVLACDRYSSLSDLPVWIRKDDSD